MHILYLFNLNLSQPTTSKFEGNQYGWLRSANETFRVRVIVLGYIYVGSEPLGGYYYKICRDLTVEREVGDNYFLDESLLYPESKLDVRDPDA